jgi:hypothetical protein
MITLLLVAALLDKPTIPALEMTIACYQCCTGDVDNIEKKECKRLKIHNWQRGKFCGCATGPKPE